MTKLKTGTTPSIGEEVSNRNSRCWEERTVVQPLRKAVWSLLIKQTCNYSTAGNLTPRYLPKRNKSTHPQKEWECFIVILFIITPKWKQPKWSSTGERINKSWQSHMIDSHSSIKGINLWYIQPHGWISKLCWIKEARHKKELSVSFIRSSSTAKIIYNDRRTVFALRVWGPTTRELSRVRQFCILKVPVQFFNVCNFSLN